MVYLVLVVGGQRGPDFIGNIMDAVQKFPELGLFAEVFVVILKIFRKVYKVDPGVQRAELYLSLLNP